MIPAPGTEVVFTYTNWRGETKERSVVPYSIRFGHTTWHPEDGWLLRAMDMDIMAIREFAMKDISNWRVREVQDNPSP